MRVFLNPRSGKSILSNKTYNPMKQYTVDSAPDDGLLEYVRADLFYLAIAALKKKDDPLYTELVEQLKG